jgi:diguanylate cyclase (GGDEF)-like protein/PAS domain S-box-containing protein
MAQAQSVSDMAAATTQILLVEDDQDDVVIFESLMRTADAGGPVAWQHAESAERARDLIGESAFDLCFFDYQIGEETGVDLLKSVRAAGLTCPITMLTGQGDETVAVEALKSGATDYLNKRGLTADRLGASIRHALNLKREADRRREAEIALRGSEARYRDLVERLPVIVCELNGDGEVLFVNDAVRALTGYGPEDLIGRDLWRMLAAEPEGSEIARMRSALSAGDIDGQETAVRSRAGEALKIEWRSRNSFAADGTLTDVLCIGLDVTERVRLREELQRMAVRDELTGLNNRRGFMTLAEQQLRQAARAATDVLAVFIDVDGLKTINDRLGHNEGDAALRDIAQVMRESFRDADIAGRLGGDEFVVLVPERKPGLGDAAVERFKENIEKFNRDNERPYHLSASTGTTRYRADQPTDIEDLINRADIAMYAEKKRRRGSGSVVKDEPTPAG